MSGTTHEEKVQPKKPQDLKGRGLRRKGTIDNSGIGKGGGYLSNISSGNRIINWINGGGD